MKECTKHLKQKQRNLLPTTKPLNKKKLDGFIHEYNHERSHESLDRRCPDEFYKPSTRLYPEKIQPITYDEGLDVRTVKRGGEIKWRNDHIYISQVLSKEQISLEEIDNDVWEVRYGFYSLGIIKVEKMKLERATQWHKKKGLAMRTSLSGSEQVSIFSYPSLSAHILRN